MQEEGAKMSQVAIRVTSITPPIPLVGMPMKQEEKPEMVEKSKF